MAAAESTVWTWGRAKNYRLGRAFVGTDARVPEKVSGFEGVAVRQAACGGGHTAVVLDDNRLFVFGYSQYGQLGLGDRNDMCDATQVYLIAPDGVDYTTHPLTPSSSSKASGRGSSVANNVGNAGAATNNTGSSTSTVANVPSPSDDKKDAQHSNNNNSNNNRLNNNNNNNTNNNNGSNNNKANKHHPHHHNNSNHSHSHHSKKQSHKNHPSFSTNVATLPVAQVACGRYHTIARTENGLVFTWGGGKNGRLGHCDEKIRAQPTWVQHLKQERALSVTAGYHNNLVLTEKGQVWSWGWGAHGQLGLGDIKDRDTPTVIEELSHERILMLSCGDRHSFAVTEDGKVYGWGSNEFGQLGCGKKHDTILRPGIIEGLQGLKIIFISSGDRHSAAITNTGAVYTWGCGTDGQCGHGMFKDVTRPKLVDKLIGKFIVDVKCGHNFTMVMTSDSEVFTWGNNTYGQLGNNGNGKSNLPVKVINQSSASISKVSCGHFHCIMWMKLPSVHQRHSHDDDVISSPTASTLEDPAKHVDPAAAHQRIKQQQQLLAQQHQQDDAHKHRVDHLNEARDRLASILSAYAVKREECRKHIDHERTRQLSDMDHHETDHHHLIT